MRKQTKKIIAGPIEIGGTAPISVQSMITANPHDKEACAKDILRLADAGCDIVRFTLPDIEAAENITYYKNAVKGKNIALVADIHFDYRVALRAAELGIDKIRINPGNIGDEARVKAVADACRERNIPIRIGVNGGSLEKDILAKYGSKVNEIGLKFLACHMCFTTEKARRDLEYMPKYTPEDAIIETALWAEKFICG